MCRELIVARPQQTNQFLAAVEPWRPVCSDADAHAGIFYSVEALRFMSWYLTPFMPATAERLQRELGFGGGSSGEGVGDMRLGAMAGKAAFPLGKRLPLFPRLTIQQKP